MNPQVIKTLVLANVLTTLFVMPFVSKYLKSSNKKMFWVNLILHILLLANNFLIFLNVS